MPTMTDMFTGETKEVKSKGKKAAQYEQPLLFPVPQIAQFGVNARPQLPINNATALYLGVVEVDPDEQAERAQREAEELTEKMFEKGEQS